MSTAREQRVRLLHAALDDELSPEERTQLDDMLAEDAALRAELSELKRTVQATAALQDAPRVDLLANVQQKLRARSGGRFYRDRFAEKQGRSALLTWALVGSFVLVLLAVLWLLFEQGLFGRAA